jgi:hypothetical protein
MKCVLSLSFLFLVSCIRYDFETEYVGYECVNNQGCDVYKNKDGHKFLKCHDGIICEGK